MTDNHWTIAGVGGRLLAGPYVACGVGPWTCSCAGGLFAVTFTPVRPDPYWSCRPVDRLELQLGDTTWSWDVPGGDCSGSLTLSSTPRKRTR